MAGEARVLVATPLLRSYGRAIVAAHRLVRAAPCPVEWLVLPSPGGYDYANLLAACERARDLALAGGYTHLLFLEDDIVAPPDAIARLLEAQAPIAYGLYCWRRAGHQWSAYQTLDEHGGRSVAEAFPQAAGAALVAGATLPVAGVGFGCTLIRRDALQRVPFRLPADYGRPGSAAPDWMFALDAGAAGLPQVAHLGVVCGHISLEPSPRVIWPDLDGEGRPSHRYELFEVT